MHGTSQLRQLPDSAALSPGVEVSSHGSTNISSLDNEHLQLPSTTLSHRHNDHTDTSRSSDQLHRRLPPTDYFLPPITCGDADSQTPPLASSMRLGGVHTPPTCYPGLASASGTVSEAIFTPEHIILLHNAKTVPNYIGPDRNIIDIAIRHLTDSPFLIDEVLAFTAFHMASLYPGSDEYFRRLATEPQTRALNSFARLTDNVPQDDKATAVPRFLFSSILGRHVLAESLAHCGSDFHFFIDRLVECINLNRGIRAVCPQAWHNLYHSEVRPFLSLIRTAEEKIISPGNECDSLIRLMDKSDLNEASIESCRKAIAALQWSFDICHNLYEEDYPQSASAFSVRLEVDFVDVLRKHRPEALVILAYYGVLLYRCRSFRAFAEAGAPLIRTITGQLSSYWQEALTWPLHVLETEPES